MKLIRTLLPFLTLCAVFILTGLILIIITDKYTLHLSTNALVGGSADQFFANYTHVGDGLFVAITILVISLLKPKEFLPNFVLGISVFAISGLLAQFLKRIVFSDVRRPVNVFGPDHLQLVDGVHMHGSFSFPSGHATASFALFIFLAFYFRKSRIIQITLGILAFFAAFSRVYLSQHFIEDIIAGAFLGIITFFVIYWLLSKYVFKKYFETNPPD